MKTQKELSQSQAAKFNIAGPVLPVWLSVVAQDPRLQSAIAARDLDQVRCLVNRLVHRHGLTAVQTLLTGPLLRLYGTDAVAWLIQVSNLSLLPPEHGPRCLTPQVPVATEGPARSAPSLPAAQPFQQSVTLSASVPIGLSSLPLAAETKLDGAAAQPRSPSATCLAQSRPALLPTTPIPQSPAPAPPVVAAMRSWLGPAPGVAQPNPPADAVDEISPPLDNSSLELPLGALAALARWGLLRPFLRQQLLSVALAGEELSQEDRQQALAAFAQEHKLASAEELERYRHRHVLTSEAFSDQVERPLKLQRHCERLYRPKAEARFLVRKTQLDRVVYSLLRLADRGLAQELYLQLLEGEANFADLAAQYSEGPERSTRGIVGPVPLTQAHPQLVDRLRTSPAGVVQEPFLVDRWWLVFRLESFAPASFDDTMARQMSQELLEQWLESAVEARLDELRPLLLTLPRDVAG